MAAFRERNTSATARLLVEIGHVGIGLGRAPALVDQNLLAETLLEAPPHVDADTGTHDHAQAVSPLLGHRPRVDQVADHFADVLEHRHAPGLHILPEARYAEATPDQHSAARLQRGTVERHQRRAVEQRQCAIEHVVLVERHHAHPAGAHRKEAAVADQRRLGQPRGARGEDVET